MGWYVEGGYVIMMWIALVCFLHAPIISSLIGLYVLVAVVSRQGLNSLNTKP